jgi:hypothetical protein
MPRREDGRIGGEAVPLPKGGKSGIQVKITDKSRGDDLGTRWGVRK